jgi:predicted MPP superfamily phosphohydrolase
MSRSTALRRVAVIGDIHAEDALLGAALESISRDLGVDAIACTGDVVDGRGSVARCCALLRQYNVTCVRGNHDRWVFSGLLRDCAGATRLEDLSETEREFLSALPPTRDLVTPCGTLLLCHGIGSADLEKITEWTAIIR